MSADSPDFLRQQRKAQALLVAGAEGDAHLRLELVRQLKDDPDAPFVIFILAGLAGLVTRRAAEAEGAEVGTILEWLGRSIADDAG